MKLFMLVCMGLSLAVMGCSGEDTRVVTPDDKELSWPASQEILFDITSVNFAWGYRLTGYYVDCAGAVYRYDHSGEIWNPSAEPIPAAELLEKYSRERELVGKILIAELSAMFELVEAASAGPLDHPVDTGCRDFGVIVHYAYLYDTQVDAYRPVLLHQRGDWGQRNNAASAKILHDWLNEQLGLESPPDCEP